MVATASKQLTPRWTPFREHLTQIRLWYSAARFKAVQAGRRSGKTELSKRFLVRALPLQIPGCLQPRYCFGAPTHDQAKDIAWWDFMDLIPEEWIEGGWDGPNVSHSTLTVRTIFNSTLRVVGLDKAHRMEGKYLNGFVGDECSDIKPLTFERVVLPMLADYSGWAWLIGVPKRDGVGSRWFNKFFNDCRSGKYPGGEAFWWPSSDIVNPKEIKHAKATLDPKTFREQYQARQESAGGRVYYAFDRERNVRPCEYDSQAEIIVASDFNVDPMCWVLGHDKGDERVEWFDELKIRDTNTPEALDVLYARYSKHKGGFAFLGDAAGRQRKSSATSTDYLLIANDKRFRKLGSRVSYPMSNPHVPDRYTTVNSMLCSADGTRRIHIDPRCENLIEELESLAYVPGTREADTSDKEVGHITDAMGYGICRLYPMRLKIDGDSPEENPVIVTQPDRHNYARM